MSGVLVIAPHPDDAALAAAGVIQQHPGDAWIVHVTAGDAFWRDAVEIDHTLAPTHAQFLALGRTRIEEAFATGNILGVPKVRNIMLGFPDGQIRDLVAPTTAGTVITSRHTGVSSVPYQEALQPGTPYTLQNLRAQLQLTIFWARPSLLIYPSRLDHNKDHSAIGWIMDRLIAPPEGATQLTYLVHHDTYPGLPWGLEYGRILVPHGLPRPWQEYTLTRPQETTKKHAIEANRSQMLAMGDWLLSFVAVNEPFHVER